MTWEGFQYEKHINPYLRISYHSDEHGYIVWRRGTGGNVELLHLKVKETRKGHGTRLFREMLRQLQAEPPYAQVFVFTRMENAAARQFYRSMGMIHSTVYGVYADGVAALLSADYNFLRKKHGIT